MHIEAYQKLTLLDFPGRTAATLFTYGCNFRCPFCHNTGLVARPSISRVPEEEIFAFLQKRKGLLDGVCITGGEPTLQSDLGAFIEKVRALGFAVKLDTNGAMPDRLKDLLDAHLIDYVAMDIKNSKAKYAETAGIDEKLLPAVFRSVDMLMGGSTPFEFRTTVLGGMHTPDDMVEIGKWLSGTKNYFVQMFKDSGDTLVGEENASRFAISREEAERLLAAVKPFLPNAALRG
ncbi:MAG: anaerobic ribonucleoside-triphosphate reductase activating protein [Clostridia bacterium]|nr:anaerobic ribonucleoside-triphosphate reductase activating protein [Clostridia bacterium]